MDKFTVLGELLYIIANYEKGRINTTGIWSRKYKKSFRESLDMMNRIIELLIDSSEVSQEALLPIIEFYQRNEGIIFPKTKICLIGKDGIKGLKGHDDSSQNDSKKRVVNYMKIIICDCYELLEHKGRRYKYRVSYLLMALHNLPRVYLDITAETLCNIGINSISEDDAIKYAISYMNKM